MDNLNYLFYEEFSRLDQLCCDVYQMEDGVSSYLAEMGGVSSVYAETVPGWIGDMEQLYRFLMVRNALAQSSDAFREPLCSRMDVDWLRQFRQRLLERKDPMALLKDHGYRADDDAQQRIIDNRIPTAEEEYRSNHDRYVNGPLVVVLIIAAVLVTCLACLFVFGKLSGL